ncbi:NmrA family transcriptional regulator [Pseudomonas sp. BRG-100]|uniref:SDR family oxidoreductase n=1 Tax=Pseudomonas sp. BRG-100 TaxID=1524267 RepID=UPI0004E71880|nr:SDR family oxidoreductase [Pseudomonas sp. BRG-100]KFF44210.1 NmrA family transcriptional regulator [Pseudomonas sp. BRG-100]
MSIAVTGATGQLGRLVIEKLKHKASASDIVALVRDPVKASNLGVAARAFDYTKSDLLDSALGGVDTLLLISSSEVGQRVPQHANVIAAAKKAGVKLIVYTSLLHADTSPLNLAYEHIQTEAALKASGVPFTLLRNGWYTENYTASIPAALANGAFYGSAGDGLISSAPRSDYAEAAAVVLTSTNHAGKVYELASDEAYTLADLAAEISKQTGRSIPYTDIPETDYAAALKGAGLPESLADGLASWDVGASKGGLFDDGHQLSKLLGRPTTPLSAVVAQALKA